MNTRHLEFERANNNLKKEESTFGKLPVFQLG
jgi:hypothetical protein